MHHGSAGGGSWLTSTGDRRARMLEGTEVALGALAIQVEVADCGLRVRRKGDPGRRVEKLLHTHHRLC